MRKEKKIEKSKRTSKYCSEKAESESRSRSRSNTPQHPPTLNSNSHSYKSCQHRKWDCESHFFELRPLENAKTYYPYTFSQFTHEGEYYPCPTILGQFKHVELIPLFGLEREGPSHRVSVKRCTQGLSHEVSRITNEQNRTYARPETIFSAVPKHQTCQVCKEEFEDYFTHIQSRKHKKEVANSLGTEYIHRTISEYDMAVYDQTEEVDQLAQMTQLCLSLEETIPLLRNQYKGFIHELHRMK